MARLARALAAPALLLLLTAAFYWKLTVSRDYTWLDSPDFAFQVLPWFQFQAAEWHAGRFPLWDPYAWGGQSLIGQAQPGAAYPLNWPLFLAPLRAGWIQRIWVHWHWVLIHVLAAWLAWRLCRDLGRSRGASLLGGMAWGVGGWMGSTEWPQMLSGAAWAPAVLLFLLRVLRDEAPLRNAALAGAALGMALLSGHHQAPTFIALAAAGLWTYGFALRRWKIAAPAAAFAAMALLVGALQVFPAVEYGRLAVRWVGAPNDPVGWKDAVPYSVHSKFGLGPESLAGILVPTLHRHANPYIGCMLAALALVGATACAARREVRVLIGLAAGGLVFSLSSFAVFHGPLYALVPMVEKARNASFAILLFHLAAAALAAFGLDAVLERGREAERWSRRTGLLLCGFAALLTLAMLGLRAAGKPQFLDQPRVLAVPVLALMAAGLLWAARQPRVPRAAIAAACLLTALYEFSTGGSTHGWRHQSTPDSLLRQLSTHGDVAAFLARQPGFPRVEVDGESVPYAFGDWHGIETMDAYTASVQANIFALQAEYKARMLMGMAFTLGRRPSRPNQVEVLTAADGLKLYLNPEAGPRVWSVHEVDRIAAQDLPAAWRPPLEDLRRRAFMTAAPPPLEPCAGDRVSLVESRPGRVVVEAEMRCAGMVVAADAWFPGWRATVDGTPTPIHEVYGAWRGVAAGRGSHRIEMTYRPGSVAAGAACTLAGLLLAALAALHSLTASRRRVV